MKTFIILSIEIKITDNGIGMSPQKVEKFNNRKFRDENLDHIGIENVQSRLEMYYGDKAKAYAKSDQNGTCITLVIAKMDFGVLADENSHS